jgi:hypothetical protein
MRLREFSSQENGSQYANLVSVLMFLKTSAQERGLSPKISTQSLINLVKNSGQPVFEFDDLLAAIEADPAVKELVKNANRDEVVIRAEHDQDVSTDSDSESSSIKNPEQTVKAMAKKALNRRQD